MRKDTNIVYEVPIRAAFLCISYSVHMGLVVQSWVSASSRLKFNPLALFYFLYIHLNSFEFYGNPGLNSPDFKKPMSSPWFFFVMVAVWRVSFQ